MCETNRYFAYFVEENKNNIIFYGFSAVTFFDKMRIYSYGIKILKIIITKSIRKKSLEKSMKNAQSDKEFFLKIYDVTFHGLRRYISYKSADLVLVDDILQEVYLEVFRHIDNLKNHENIEGWSFRTGNQVTSSKRNGIEYTQSSFS